MSSPIGGFYLNAQYRKKAAKFELSNKPTLTVAVEVSIEGNTVIIETQTCTAEHEFQISSNHVSLKVLPTVINAQMIRLAFALDFQSRQFNSLQSRKQIVNLSPGERLSVLMEGDEHIKLTTSCLIV